jgi:MOSC domain-containing protein
MKEFKAKLISVHSGNNEDLSKAAHASLDVKADGFEGDKHRGFTRIAADWDPEPTGTVRRNERQWSGVSMEELAIIQERMDLKEPLAASTLGANICVEGIPDFSRLPKGSKLIFPSAAVLIIEEENPPCLDMGLEIEKAYTSNSDEPVVGKLFPKHALHLRGVVGFVDIAGVLNAGDEITVQVYESPL